MLWENFQCSLIRLINSSSLASPIGTNKGADAGQHSLYLYMPKSKTFFQKQLAVVHQHDSFIIRFVDYRFKLSPPN